MLMEANLDPRTSNPSILPTTAQVASSDPTASNHSDISTDTSAIDDVNSAVPHTAYATRYRSTQADDVSVSPPAANPQPTHDEAVPYSQPIIQQADQSSVDALCGVQDLRQPCLPRTYPSLAFLLQDDFLVQFPSLDRFAKLVTGTLGRAIQQKQIHPYIEVYFCTTRGDGYIVLYLDEAIAGPWHHGPQLCQDELQDLFGPRIWSMVVESKRFKTGSEAAFLQKDTKGTLIYLALDWYELKGNVYYLATEPRIPPPW